MISRKSGAIFERKLIEEYISAHGKDPISEENLTIEDLTKVQGVPEYVPPQLPSLASIPNLLKTFQNEWDALALEVFSLRKQLHKARQELSASLYHYDAAVRVAAKATEERDEAQRALKELSQAVGNGVSQIKNDIDNGHPYKNGDEIPVSTNNILLSDIAEELEVERERLFAQHKAQKKTTKQFSGADYSIQMKENIPLPFKTLATVAYRDGMLALASTAGSITIVDVQNDANTTKIVRKGKPSNITLIKSEGQVVPVATTKDKIFVGSEKTSLQHSGEIIAIASHPTLAYFVVVGRTGWLLATTNSIIHQDSTPYISAAFHIDGKLVALGSSSAIDIVDISTAEKVAAIEFSNANKLLFAPNGYWLLALSNESLLVIDIRTQSVVGNIEGSFKDFVIDPTSTIIIATSEDSIFLYKYSKSEKQWMNEPVVHLDQGIRSIFILDDVHFEDYLQTGDIPFIGIDTDIRKGELKKEN